MIEPQVIERRKPEQLRTLTKFSLSLSILAILAVAFSVSLRIIQTVLLPQQLNLIHFTQEYFDKLNGSFEYTLMVSLVLSGLIIDLIGPRTILGIAIITSVIANYFYSMTSSINILLMCRLLTEYSNIFILTGALTIGLHWLPKKYLSTYVGLVFGTLLLIPFYISSRFQVLITAVNTTHINLLVTLGGVFLFVILLIARNIPDMTRRRGGIYSHFFPLRYYKIWLIGLTAMAGWVANTFFLNIGAYYLLGRNFFTAAQAVTTIDHSYVFFGIGCMMMGVISDYLHNKQRVIAISYIVAALAFLSIIFASSLTTNMVSYLIYLIEFLVGANIISYTLANNYCRIENSGITVGLVLSISTIGSSLFSSYGHDYVQKNIFSALTQRSQEWDYVALSIPVLLAIAAVIAGFLIKHTHVQDSKR